MATSQKKKKKRRGRKPGEKEEEKTPQPDSGAQGRREQTTQVKQGVKQGQRQE